MQEACVALAPQLLSRGERTHACMHARTHTRTHRYVTAIVNIERYPAAAVGYAIRYRDVTLYGAGPGLDFRATR